MINNLTASHSINHNYVRKFFSYLQIEREENADKYITLRERSPGYITTDSVTYKSLKPFSRANRKNPTRAEAILWDALRNRKIGGKFRRQHAIEKFIVDFVCLQEKLIIEIDGKYHSNENQVEYDKARTKWLNMSGYKELRFKNEEVINSPAKVIDTIKHFLKTKEIKYS